MFLHARSPEIFKCKQNICLVIVTVAIGIVIYRAPCIIQQRSFSTNQIILTRLLNPPKLRKLPFEHVDGEDNDSADDDDGWWYLLKISSEPIQSLYYRASVKRDWFPDLLVAETSQNKFWVRENFSQNYFLLQESSAQWNQSSSFWTPYFSGKCSALKSR